MAFIHTNFLTGNDTTGNGSTTTPYKTIFKALGLAASGDTIKVAGGQWSPIVGTFTFAQGNNIIATTTSMVGKVAVDDVLTFEDGDFGFDKFHLKVTGVSTTTVTVATAWPGTAQITSQMFKLSAFNYSSAASTSFETWNTTAVQPLGRTGITISGGWNSDYSSNANSWTAVRRTGQGTTQANGATPALFNITTASNKLGDWRDNLIFDRFMLVNVARLAEKTVVNSFAPWSYSSFAVREIALVRAAGLANGVTTNGGNGTGYGLWNPPGEISKFYMTGSSFNSANSVPDFINYYTAVSVRPTLFTSEVWNTATVPSGFNSAIGNLSEFGLSTTFNEPSLNQTTLHFRTNTYLYYDWPAYSGAYPGYTSVAPIGTTSITFPVTQSVYYNKLYIHASSPNNFNIGMPSVTNLTIQDIELTGPQAAVSTVNFGSAGSQTFIDLSQEGKLIEDLRPGIGFNSYAYGPASIVDPAFNLSKLVQTYSSPVSVLDAEGLKTLDGYNNIYFKDTVNNCLRVTNPGVYSGNWGNGGSTSPSGPPFKIWQIVGVQEKPDVAFTVQVVLKVSAGCPTDTLAIQYGPMETQLVSTTIAPTSEYATYYLTVNPASYSDWTSYKFPLYVGLRTNPYNTFYNQTATSSFIQSISISY